MGCNDAHVKYSECIGKTKKENIQKKQRSDREGLAYEWLISVICFCFLNGFAMVWGSVFLCVFLNVFVMVWGERFVFNLFLSFPNLMDRDPAIQQLWAEMMPYCMHVG